jgi:hypothetical protein
MDEQILSQPWGERSFSAQDPFKNSLGFVDEATAIQQASEQSTAGPDDCLKTGFALSIRSITGESDGQLAAAVTKIFTEEVWLNLAEAPAAPFKPGEKVRIQFGDGETVFFSETEIVKSSPTDAQYVAIAVPEKSKPLKKRAIPRIRSEVPVSVSVLSAVETQLVSAEPFDSKTHDISTAGLRFDTSFPLNEEDELELKLLLSPEQEITVSAKVMGTKQVKRGGEEVTLVGTQFVEIQLEDQIKLLQFLIDEEESGKTASQDVPDQPEEPKTVPSTAPEAPSAAPAAPAEAKSEPKEPKVAPVAMKFKEEEQPKAPPPAASEATPAAPEPPAAPSGAPAAPAAMKFKEEEPKAAPPAAEAPSVAPAVPPPAPAVPPPAPAVPPAAPAASAEPKAAPVAMKFKEGEPKAASPADGAPSSAPAAPPPAPAAPPPAPAAPPAAPAAPPAAPAVPPAAPAASAEPTTAPAAVKSQESPEAAQSKDLSWFAAQMSKTGKGSEAKAAAAPAAKPAEKPSAPIVQASPSVQSGKAFLELSNGYHQPVTVKDVFAAKGAGSLTPLLTEPKQLSPGETQRLDVTELLLPLFQQENSEAQDKLLHILFTLEPEPPDQPAPSRSLLRFAQGNFTEFSIK